MTIRRRLFWVAALLALVPLAATGFAIRTDVAERLDRQLRARADALVSHAAHSLELRRADLDDRLASLAETARSDNRLRLALAGGDDAAYVRDWAPRAQALTGLDALLLVNDRGEILSSGAFRNDFGRVDAATPAFLEEIGVAAGIVRARRPAGEFLAIARLKPLELSGARYRLIAGFELSAEALAALTPDPDVTATLAIADRTPLVSGSPDGGPRLERVLELPALLPDAPERARATITFAHSLAARESVLRAVDLRLLLSFGLAAPAALGLAVILAARLARPLEQLAEKTRAVDLDHLDADFATDRADEIGALSRFLEEMTERLRASVSRLRDAERRATLGDLARQVNHDLKNAFPPLRNVVHHLAQVANDPPELSRVFTERRSTLDAGLAYLDELATNWRRLAGRSEKVPCDLAGIAKEAAAGRAAAGCPVEVNAAAGVPKVLGDPTALRRILDNLLANACESGARTVVVSVRSNPPAGVHLVVEDDGPGIPDADKDHVFEPYWTTKPEGTGLGLSIVRRLVSDHAGSLSIEDREPRGTRILIALPAEGPRLSGPVAEEQAR